MFPPVFGMLSLTLQLKQVLAHLFGGPPNAPSKSAQTISNFIIAASDMGHIKIVILQFFHNTLLPWVQDVGDAFIQQAFE